MNHAYLPWPQSPFQGPRLKVWVIVTEKRSIFTPILLGSGRMPQSLELWDALLGQVGWGPPTLFHLP